MKEHKELEALFEKHGYTDFRWIEPRDIVVAEWVRMKCRFGCHEYARNASCPPYVPSVEECRQFFGEYSTAAAFHFQASLKGREPLHAWSKETNQGLLSLEREVFLSGRNKAFLLFMDSCAMCDGCPGIRGECKSPKLARPTPEGLAVDVYTTVRRYGFPIQVLKDPSETMNRYAFLMVE